MGYVCEDCEHMDVYDTNNYGEAYCTYHRKYYPKDDRTCREFTQKSGSSSSCFLTSACVSAKGLPDNCDELTTLRKYRDEYLSQSTDGKALIEEYYRIAPSIVKQIELAPNKLAIYDQLYTDILECVHLIKNNLFIEARDRYIDLVHNTKSMTEET